MSEITKQILNSAVKALAEKDRPAAVLILAKFGAMNTVELPPEKWQAVYDEALSKIDANAKP
jgi:hypothetical protein